MGRYWTEVAFGASSLQAVGDIVPQLCQLQPRAACGDGARQGAQVGRGVEVDGRGNRAVKNENLAWRGALIRELKAAPPDVLAMEVDPGATAAPHQSPRD